MIFPTAQAVSGKIKVKSSILWAPASWWKFSSGCCHCWRTSSAAGKAPTSPLTPCLQHPVKKRRRRSHGKQCWLQCNKPSEVKVTQNASWNRAEHQCDFLTCIRNQENLLAGRSKASCSICCCRTGGTSSRTPFSDTIPGKRKKTTPKA